jgi:hypothetical protein
MDISGAAPKLLSSTPPSGRESAADEFQEDEVSFAKLLFASAIAAAFATPALAQESVRGWRPGLAYAVGMDGELKVMQPRDPNMAALKKHAKPVPRGMMFFIDNGRVYMIQAAAACSNQISRRVDRAASPLVRCGTLAAAAFHVEIGSAPDRTCDPPRNAASLFVAAPLGSGAAVC